MSSNKSWIGSYVTKAMTTASELLSQVSCQIMAFVASGTFLLCVPTYCTYIDLLTGRHLPNYRPPHSKTHDHVVHNNDRLNATAKGNEGGGGRERERLGVKALLDAYHQRELKSCNRSKKHPWAVNRGSGGGEGNGK